MGGTRLHLVAAGAAIAIAGVCAVVLGRPALSSDVIHALIWGRDALDGRMPQYADGPTPHPLQNVIGAALSPLGAAGAYHGSEVLALLYFGALLACVALLGRTLFSLPVGVLAAVLLATEYGSLWRAMSGFYDVPALALAIGALLALLAGRPLVVSAALLALAGLIRPEYWLFSAGLGTYALVARRGRERALVAAVCAAAPALWIVSDAVVTGSPVWSLTHTQDLAAELGRGTGLDQAPGAFVDQLRRLVSGYVMLLAAAGTALAFAARRQGALVLLAVVAAGAVTYLLIGVAGLSLIDRYLLPSAIALTLLASYAAAGWAADRARLPRMAVLGVGGAATLLLLTTVPTRIREVRAVRDDDRRRVAILDDLRRVAARARTCPPLYVSYARGIVRPTVAHALDLTPGDLRVLGEPADAGTFIVPGARETATSVRVRPTDRVELPAPAGRPVTTTSYWRVTRGARCGA